MTFEEMLRESFSPRRRDFLDAQAISYEHERWRLKEDISMYNRNFLGEWYTREYEEDKTSWDDKYKPYWTIPSYVYDPESVIVFDNCRRSEETKVISFEVAMGFGGADGK